MNHGRGGLAFAGCMFLGIGIGLLFDEAGVGTMIGFGAGFLAMAFLGRKEE